MEMFMKETTKMVKNMEMELKNMRVEVFMKETTKMVSIMEKVLKMS